MKKLTLEEQQNYIAICAEANSEVKLELQDRSTEYLTRAMLAILDEKALRLDEFESARRRFQRCHPRELYLITTLDDVLETLEARIRIVSFQGPVFSLLRDFFTELHNPNSKSKIMQQLRELVGDIVLESRAA